MVENWRLLITASSTVLLQIVPSHGNVSDGVRTTCLLWLCLKYTMISLLSCLYLNIPIPILDFTGWNCLFRSCLMYIHLYRLCLHVTMSVMVFLWSVYFIYNEVTNDVIVHLSLSKYPYSYIICHKMILLAKVLFASLHFYRLCHHMAMSVMAFV